MLELRKLPQKEYRDTVNRSPILCHCAQLRGSAGSAEGCGNLRRELELLRDSSADSRSTAATVTSRFSLPYPKMLSNAMGDDTGPKVSNNLAHNKTETTRGWLLTKQSRCPGRCGRQNFWLAQGKRVLPPRHPVVSNRLDVEVACVDKIKDCDCINVISKAAEECWMQWSDVELSVLPRLYQPPASSS